MKTRRILFGLFGLLTIVLAASFFSENLESGFFALTMAAPLAIGSITIVTSDDAKQERHKLYQQMAELLNTAKRERRNLTEIENREYELLKSDHEALSKEVDRLEAEEKRQIQNVINEITGGKHFNNDDAGQWQDSDGRQIKVFGKDQRLSTHFGTKAGKAGQIIRGLATGKFLGVAPEERAALSVSNSGAVVPLAFMSTIVDSARAKSVVLSNGALLALMENNQLTIARVATDPAMSAKAENDAFGANEMVFDSVVLKSFTVGGVLKISNELLSDSPNAAAALEQAMAGALAAEIDRLALFGAGTTEPLGVFNTSDVEAESLSAAITYSNVLSGWVKIAGNNGTPKTLALAPRDYVNLQAVEITTGGGYKERPEILKDVNFVHSSVLPVNGGTGENEGSGILGDFSQLVIGLRQNITVESGLDADAFNRNQTAIRCIWRGDVGVLRPGHFCKFTGIAPAGS